MGVPCVNHEAFIFRIKNTAIKITLYIVARKPENAIKRKLI